MFTFAWLKAMLFTSRVYSSTSFTINVNITDGKTHQLALYLLDWNKQGLGDKVDILDATTGKVLSTETASNFQNGEYLVWDISGNVQIRITRQGSVWTQSLGPRESNRRWSVVVGSS